MAAIAILSSCGKDDPVNPDNPDNPDNPTEVLVWSTNLPHTVQTATNHFPAIDDKGNIYLITKEYGVGSIIQAFDKNGNELWKKQKDEYPRNFTISYHNENVYFLTNNELICLDAQNGSDKWIFTGSAEYELEIGAQDNFCFINSMLYIPMKNNKGTFLGKINPSNGVFAMVGKINEQNRVVPRIAAKGNTIYAADDSLYAISESGFILWKANIENTEHTTKDVYDLIVTQNNDIVVSTKSEMNNQRSALLYKSEELAWSTNFGTNVLTPKIVELSDGDLILAMGDLIKVNAQNGDEIWKLDSEILKSFETANIAADGNIYGGNAYGIWGIDNTGNTIFEFDANGDPLSTPILQNDENIIVLSMGTENSIIHCIKKENTDGNAQNAWSSYGANPANTFYVN